MLKLSKKHQTTLDDIFKIPIKSSVNWYDIEKMLIAVGAQISEGRGSRVRIYLNNIRAVFHRPHPKKEVDKSALKSIRRFLKETGVKNDEL